MEKWGEQREGERKVLGGIERERVYICLKSFVSTIEADLIRHTYVFMLIMSISGKNVIETTRCQNEIMLCKSQEQQ